MCFALICAASASAWIAAGGLSIVAARIIERAKHPLLASGSSAMSRRDSAFARLGRTVVHAPRALQLEGTSERACAFCMHETAHKFCLFF